MIVVDSNIIAYLYLPCEYTASAEALLERDPDWAAPMLWRSEFRNILAGYVRRKTISFEYALSLQSEAESLMEGSEFEVDSRAVLELVRDSDCSAYDCVVRRPGPESRRPPGHNGQETTEKLSQGGKGTCRGVTERRAVGGIRTTLARRGERRAGDGGLPTPPCRRLSTRLR